MASGRGTISWDRDGVGAREILKNDSKFTFWAILGIFLTLQEIFQQNSVICQKKLHFFGVREGLK